MKLIENPLIGADIELFLQSRRSGRIVSAEGYIKGSKYKPYNFDPSNPYFAVSLDNVLAEFCIPPSNKKEDFMNYIAKSRAYIESTIPKRFCTVAQPAALLQPRYLKTDNARTFGCEPDYNVWLRINNEKPISTNERLRSAGGHIHLGYDNVSAEVSEFIVKAFDLYLAVPSVLQEPDNERKLLYGKAGAFRFKEYGVEYRTISNYYLQKPKLTEWVFDSAMEAVEFINEGRAEELDYVDELIQKAINNNDKGIAKDLIRNFKLQLA